jgi:transposase
MSDNFRLSDAQWAAIAPLLPMVHTGPVRQDDRRIISGILHRLREGCRWRALPAEYGPYYDGVQPVQPVEQARPVAGYFQRAGKRCRTAERDDDRQHRGASAPGGERRKRGERGQAIGRSRGGRTTKIHVLIDQAGS